MEKNSNALELTKLIFQMIFAILKLVGLLYVAYILIKDILELD